MMFISILSYLYIPSQGGDKSYYINLFNYFSTIEFNEGFKYIRTKLDDFTLYFLILIFSQLGISFSILFGLISGITIGVLFYLFYKSADEFNLSKFSTLFFFAILLCTISLPSFFSGIRFYFALAFNILGLYLCFTKNKGFKGLLSIIFATSIHFSSVVILIPTLIYILFKRNLFLLKVAYFFSFIFLVVPTTSILSLLNYLPLIDIDVRYLSKIIGYMSGKEFIVTNAGHAIYLLVGKLWFYLITFYALATIHKSENKWLAPLLILLVIANVTFLFPWLFNRYAYITVIVFLFVLINDYKKYKLNYFFVISFSIISVMTTSLDVVVQRKVFKESYMRIAVLTSPTIIMIDPMDGQVFSKGQL